MKKYTAKKYSGGNAVMISVLFFLIISGTIISGITVPTSNRIKSARESLKARQSYFAADSADDDALYRLNKGWTLPSSFTLPFSNNVTSSATVTTSGDNTTVTAVGDAGIPARSSESVFSQGTGMSFTYASQVGTGGIDIGGGSTINGSVYTSGDINMTSGGATITGSATVASALDPDLDQTNSTSTPIGIDFGKTAANQDVAQGFQVSASTAVSYLRVALKKTGAPGNLTIRITGDSSGKPSGTTLFSSTILASNVTTSYKYFVIPLTSSLSLTPGTQYWIVYDYGSNSATKYYTAESSDNTYSSGSAKIGSWSSSGGGSWLATSPSTADLFFDVFLGGTVKKIQGLDSNNRIQIGSGSTGNAWAYEIDNANVAGNAYCQFSSSLFNLSGVVKNCTNQVSAVILDYPISSTDISEWKTVVTDATNAISGGWTYTGNLTINYAGTTTSSLKRVNGNLTLSCSSAPATFGDLYVTGSISIGSGCDFIANTLKVGTDFNLNSGSAVVGLTKVAGTTGISGGSTMKLKETFWSVGDITQGGGSHIKLDSSKGASDGVIISDGKIDTSGGGDFDGSGTSGSYIVGISLATCPTGCTGNAITISGGAGAVVMFAPYGTLSIYGGATLKNATALKLTMSGGSSIIYDSGLASLNFTVASTSPWVVESWDEIGQ